MPADEDTKDKKPEAKEVQPDHVPTLDEVNDLTQAKLEHEEDEDPDTSKDDDDADDDKPDVDEPDEPADTGKVAPEPSPSPEPSDADAKAVPAEPATELDPDTTKPGKGKVAIKALDGKTYYFNNLDEVPDDFEPATYKELMAGTRALYAKEDKDARDAEKAEAEAQKAEHTKQVDKMSQGWQTEEESLKKDGLIPRGKDGEQLTKEVYDYMAKQLNKGVMIDSFTEAYKAVSYEKMQQEREEEQKQLNDKKKERGGRVQSGGANNPAKSTVREAPPPGVGLDAVHAHALNSL